ncbi:hypothetical protein C8J31_110151 [Rhizobium sp. PP-CC-2G-626]|nr:hypothetical protein C8J31_110151 [Rhizobium sp. PP-CC-2G-626]
MPLGCSAQASPILAHHNTGDRHTEDSFFSSELCGAVAMGLSVCLARYATRANPFPPLSLPFDGTNRSNPLTASHSGRERTEQERHGEKPAITRRSGPRPPSVRRTPRCRLSNSKIPRSSSSVLIRVLTLDWLMPSLLAAWRKFRHSAIASTCIREASGMRPSKRDVVFTASTLVRSTRSLAHEARLDLESP